VNNYVICIDNSNLNSKWQCFSETIFRGSTKQVLIRSRQLSATCSWSWHSSCLSFLLSRHTV